jgi:formylglycine-generating enzyme required for sulfatase activity
VAQYDEWLNLPPDPADQRAICSENTDFKPSTAIDTSCEHYKYDKALSEGGKEPVRCADWCDAAAFCEWAGKRLCGKIGGETNPQGAAVDPTSSQWYRACSWAGSRQFPYGDSYNKNACVGADFNDPDGYDPLTDFARDVGGAKVCEGGYKGLFDMSGNVREWEDSCNVTVGTGDKCYARGGAYGDSVAVLTCSSVSEHTRGAGAIFVGFRCCAELE